MTRYYGLRSCTALQRLHSFFKGSCGEQNAYLVIKVIQLLFFAENPACVSREKAPIPSGGVSLTRAPNFFLGQPALLKFSSGHFPSTPCATDSTSFVLQMTMTK